MKTVTPPIGNLKAPKFKFLCADNRRARAPECPASGCANMTEYCTGTSRKEAEVSQRTVCLWVEGRRGRRGCSVSPSLPSSPPVSGTRRFLAPGPSHAELLLRFSPYHRLSGPGPRRHLGPEIVGDALYTAPDVLPHLLEVSDF